MWPMGVSPVGLGVAEKRARRPFAPQARCLCYAKVDSRPSRSLGMTGSRNCAFADESYLRRSMSVFTKSFDVPTRGKGTYEITDEIAKVVRQSEIKNGTATVFVRHTSCSLVIMENAAPAARRDLERFFEQLVPENADYEHDDEGADDSTSHIRMVLTRSSEVIPIVDGELQLGTWQGIFLFEHRRASHRRKIVVMVMG